MQTINVPFEDAEMEKLTSVKGSRNWHDFIMLLADMKIKKPINKS